MSDNKIASYPTSIITRIETRDWKQAPESLNRFLPHFHYNKDWNGQIKAQDFTDSELLTPLPL